MRKLRRVLLVLVALVLVGGLLRWAQRPRVERGSVLAVELAGAYVESPEPPVLARLVGREERSLVAQLSELRKAARDERLSAVLLRIRNLQVGWAKAQELRDAIVVLREAGRRPIALLEAESFDGNMEYYVASAAKELYVAPGGHVPLVGLAAEFFFLGGLWEKLGVSFEVERVGRYKSAVETLTGRRMSAAHREMAEALLDSVDAQFVAGIAEGRGMPESAVRKAIAAAPTRPADLVERGLVDGVRTRRAILEALGDPPLVSAQHYARVDARSVVGEPAATFALVYGSGAGVAGRGRTSRTGAPVLAADTVVEALEDAAEDASVDAILLRIDSPGGSPSASEQVWQAVRRARESKPVVASLSDVAASGGYYLASAADSVVADPATLTGSIGAFVLRPVLKDLLAQVGIASEGLTRGPHAEVLLASRPLSADTRAWLRADLEGIYATFVERVAEGRELETAQVDALGRGRVWTGAQAAERGLVDEVGGLRVAAARAKQRLGFDPDAPVALVPYPPPKPLATQIREALEGAAARAWTASWPAPASVARLAAWLEALPADTPLLVPPLVIEIR